MCDHVDHIQRKLRKLFVSTKHQYRIQSSLGVSNLICILAIWGGGKIKIWKPLSEQPPKKSSPWGHALLYSARSLVNIVPLLFISTAIATTLSPWQTEVICQFGFQIMETQRHNLPEEILRNWAIASCLGASIDSRNSTPSAIEIRARSRELYRSWPSLPWENLWPWWQVVLKRLQAFGKAGGKVVLRTYNCDCAKLDPHDWKHFEELFFRVLMLKTLSSPS